LQLRTIDPRDPVRRRLDRPVPHRQQPCRGLGRAAGEQTAILEIGIGVLSRSIIRRID
jgi:hypothetical protein